MPVPVVKRNLVFLLGALAGLGPLTLNMYLPALPTLGVDLEADPSAVQLTLMSFLIGFAIGQVVYGPLSDSYGRKRPLYVGLALYIVATIGCFLAPTIGSLIGFRFLQALGGCAGMIVARAIVRDIATGQEAARLFSSMMLVMGLAPILAPLLGSYVLIWSNWRVIFLILAVFSALCLVSCIIHLPETLAPPARRPGSIPTAVRTYGILVREREFMGFSLATGFAMATLFTYITASPYFFVGLYNMSPTEYAWLFGLNAAGFTGASLLNQWLLKKWNLYQILQTGIKLAF